MSACYVDFSAISKLATLRKAVRIIGSRNTHGCKEAAWRTCRRLPRICGGAQHCHKDAIWLFDLMWRAEDTEQIDAPATPTKILQVMTSGGVTHKNTENMTKMYPCCWNDGRHPVGQGGC